MSRDPFERIELDPEELTAEVMRFYDEQAAEPRPPVVETEAELLNPETLAHDVDVQTPGSRLLERTIDLSFIED